MLALQPLALTLVRGQHLALGLEGGLDVHYEIRRNSGAEAIYASERIHEVEMPDGMQRRGWIFCIGGVVGDRRRKGRITHQDAGGFVIAMIVNR